MFKQKLLTNNFDQEFLQANRDARVAIRYLSFAMSNLLSSYQIIHCDKFIIIS